MESDLSKMDIIHLIRGTEIPDYKIMFEIKNMGLGDYIGGFVDSFEWNNTNSESWDKYSEEELLKLYKELTKNKVMKANEALKSKFVYPDKLYARCKDNKTLDMSYAPQNMEAVEYIRTDIVEDKFEDTKEQVMRDIAWKVHAMISEGKSIAEIDHYVCGMCDF